MTACDAVAWCWNDLMHRRGLAGSASQDVLDELVATYCEPHRAYHTLDHIAALLGLLAEHGQDAEDRDALKLTILFHDAIYDPSRNDNELRVLNSHDGCCLSLDFPWRRSPRLRTSFWRHST